MIHRKKGNIFNFGNIRCQQVNCKGVMGRGLALEMRDKYPGMFEEYKNICTVCGAKALGEVQFYMAPDGAIIANCFGQDDYGTNKTKTNYEALDSCLGIVAELAVRHDLVVAIPSHMGCGLAGGNWNTVYGLIKKHFGAENQPECLVCYYEQAKDDILLSTERAPIVHDEKSEETPVEETSTEAAPEEETPAAETEEPRETTDTKEPSDEPQETEEAEEETQDTSDKPQEAAEEVSEEETTPNGPEPEEDAEAEEKPAEAAPRTGGVTLYSDGACSGNPGPGGWGTVLLFGQYRKELSGSEAETTNNRMELTGVIMGLKALKKPCVVDIYSDSQYVVNAMSKGWVKTWKAKGWKRKDGKATMNPDLWQELLDLCEKHDVQFHWVKGHAENENNNRCDELAVEAYQKYLK